MADYNLVKQALERGYSLDEVADKLSGSSGMDAGAIRERGYSSDEILAKLGYIAPTLLAEDENTALGNVGRLLKTGANTAAQDVRELVGKIPVAGEKIQSSLDWIDEKTHSGISSEELLKSDTEAMQSKLGPAMKEAIAKKWWDQDTNSFGDAWKDPRAYEAGILQSLPEQVLMMFPVMRMAKTAYASKIAAGASAKVAAASAARTAQIAGTIIEGGLGGAQASRKVREEILDKSKVTDEMLSTSDAYQSLVDQGMSQEDARKELAENQASRAFITAGVATGMFGGMGDRFLAKIVTGTGQGIAKRFATGALSEGLAEELPQSYLQQVAENEALQGANKNQSLTDDALNQALGGMATGSIQGGGMAAAFGSKGSAAPIINPTDILDKTKSVDESIDIATSIIDESLDAHSGLMSAPQAVPQQETTLTPVTTVEEVQNAQTATSSAGPVVAGSPAGERDNYTGIDASAILGDDILGDGNGQLGIPAEPVAGTGQNQPIPDGGDAAVVFETPYEQNFREKTARAAVNKEKYGMSEEDYRDQLPENALDKATGYHTKEHEKPTIEAALKHAESTGKESHHIAIDFANLGGLNNHYNNQNHLADVPFLKSIEIAREELSKVTDRVVMLKPGGDEFSAVTIGGNTEEINNALSIAKRKIRAYAIDQGLADIPRKPNQNEDGSYPDKTTLPPFGIGIYAGVTKISSGMSAGDVMDLSTLGVDEQKKLGRRGLADEQTRGINQAARAGTPERQAGTTERGIESVLQGTKSEAGQLAQKAKSEKLTPVSKRTASNNLLQRIKEIGGISKEYMTADQEDAVNHKGLFREDGRGLDDLAISLSRDFPVQKDDIEGLQELIRSAIRGETVLTHAQQEANTERQEKIAHNDAIRAEAKALGIKTVARKMSEITDELVRKQEAIAKEKEKLLRTRLERLEIDLDEVMAEAQARLSEDEASAALLEAYKQIDEQGIADEEAQFRLQIKVVSEKIKEAKNEQTGQTAPQPARGSDQTGRDQTGVEENQAGEGFLKSQTNAEIARLEAKAAKAKDEAEKEAPSKNVTSDQVDMFNTQGGMFDQPATKKEVNSEVSKAKEALQAADKADDLNGIYEASQALDNAVVPIIQAKLDAGEMAVFKGRHGLTYAVHPATDGENVYQVTMYNDNGAQGDTRYKTLLQAVKDSRISNLDMLDSDAANKEMDRLAKAEGEYQDKKSAQKTAAEAAKAAFFAQPTSEAKTTEATKAKKLDVIKAQAKGEVTGDQAAALKELADAGEHAAVDAVLKPEVKAEKPANAEAAPAEAEARTRAAHDVLFERIYKGEASIDEFKSAFEALANNKEGVLAELNAMTKVELFKAYPGLEWRYKNDKKAEVADAAFRSMQSDFTLGESFSHGMGRNAYEDGLRAVVNRTTEDDLAKFAESVRTSKAERAAQRAEAEAGMENPETLEDFQRIMAAKAREIGEDATFAQARMAMTPEQRAKYDELAADKSRADRASRKTAQQEQSLRAPGEAVETTDIIKTKHTKHGHDLWQFQMVQRVSPEEFKSLATQAKRLGGDYSSYRGNGAIPGWQFRSEESAKAFKALVAGDTAQAKDVMQTRRDAYADDRSQTAVERLTEMADALDEKADASLNQERKSNTARRARFAASAEASANSDKAMAQTMRNIAAGIENGTAKLLDRVRQKVQVEMLQGFVRTSFQEQFQKYADQEKNQPSIETADYAKYPSYTAYRSDLASLGRALLEVEGTMKLGQRLMKVADDVSDSYLKFAKDNLLKVSAFSTKDGARAAFPNKASAEASIARSGYKGAAIVLPVKRNENLIILSPSEAIKRGIWEGDNDKRISLSADFGEELVEKIGKAARRGAKVSVPWQFENAYNSRKRLSGMNIETPAELRAALREFIGLRETAKEPDKIKQMERAMIGRKNDGFDFFPTPAVAADDAIAAADIKEGMTVYEPQAGMGHIADRIREAGVEPDVGEIASDRRELLEAKGYNIVSQDFMDMRLEDTPNGEGYDRIIMNPPFSDRRDAMHVQHAYGLLKPGGRLVSIMGEGVFFGQDKKAESFREWLDKVGGTEEKLEQGTFLDPSLPVNTGVSARMVVIDKSETDKGTALYSRAQSYPELAAALEKYEGTGELATVQDLANEVDVLIGEDLAPDSLEAAIEDYRQELADDHAYAGRGDMEAADERFVDAVRAALAAKQSRSTQHITNPHTIESAQSAMLDAHTGADRKALQALLDSGKARVISAQQAQNITGERLNSKVDQTDTPAFKKWAGSNEPVIESDEIDGFDFSKKGPFVIRAYHGTTNEFYAFDASKKGNMEGQFGAVNYFTSSESDATDNYAGNGPDLTQRIELKAERLENDINDLFDEGGIDALNERYGEDVYDEDRMQMARNIVTQELHGGQERVMEVFIRTDNPFVVGDAKSPWFEFFNEEELESQAIARIADNEGVSPEDIEADMDTYRDQVSDARYEIMDEEQSPFVQAAQNVAAKYEFDPADLLASLYEIAGDGAVRHNTLEEYLRQNESLSYAEHPEGGSLIQSHMIGEIIQELGFDSIILKNANVRFKNMNIEHGAAHIHVFDANNTNIKSATENVGTFDPSNQDIRYSKDGRALAFFNQKDGITYFIADSIPESYTAAEWRGLVRHEISTHAFQLGKDSAEFKDILKQVELMNKAGNKAVRAAFKRVPEDTAPENVTEEAVGYMVQESPDLPIVKRIVAWFRNAIRAIGKSMPVMQRAKFFEWAAKLNENDILYMAQTAMAKSVKTDQETSGQPDAEGVMLSRSDEDAGRERYGRIVAKLTELYGGEDGYESLISSANKYLRRYASPASEYHEQLFTARKLKAGSEAVQRRLLEQENATQGSSGEGAAAFATLESRGRIGNFDGYVTEAGLQDIQHFGNYFAMEVWPSDFDGKDGALDSPVLTLTINPTDDTKFSSENPHGELVIYGPKYDSETFRILEKKGWAEVAKGKDGKTAYLPDGKPWTRLTGATPAQLTALLAEAHARIRMVTGAPHIGINWDRATGATGFATEGGDKEASRKSAIYFSRQGGLPLQGGETGTDATPPQIPPRQGNLSYQPESINVVVDGGNPYTNLFGDIGSRTTISEEAFNFISFFGDLLVSVGVKPSVSKGFGNGLVRNAEVLSNVTKTPSFVEHGYSGLNAPAKLLVLESVGNALYNRQILNSVVELIPVDVMNLISSGKFSTEKGLHDMAMLGDRLPIDGNNPVSVAANVAASVVADVAASQRAKGSPGLGKLGMKPHENFPTNKTGTLNAQHDSSYWNIPEMSMIDDLIYKLQDGKIDLKRVIEEIKATGKELSDSFNTYLQEELFHGRAAKRTQDFVNTEMRPLLDDMRMRGLTIEQLDEYLHARHAKEANALIAERDPDMPDGGSGMTNQEADDYMAGLSGSQKTRLDAVAKRVDAILAKTRDMYATYGLVSKDQTDAWGKMFKHYVPLMREDHDGGMGMGQGFSVKGKEVKHRTGSTAKVVDILANIALQREKAITRGEKNRVAVSLFGLVKLNPNPDFWTAGKVPTERVLNEKSVLVEERIDPMFKSKPNAIVAKISDGKGNVVERAVIFNERNERAMRMAESLKNLDTAQMEGLWGASAQVTRYFASVNTQYNPVFGVTNIVRDVQGMALNLDNTALAKHKLDVLKAIPGMLKGIYQDARMERKGHANDSATSQLWEELQDEGGMTGYRDLYRNSEDRANAIKHELNPHNWVNNKWGKVFTAGGMLKVPLTKAQDMAGPIFNWLTDYNQTLEGATRLAVYKVALDNGFSKPQAASLAKNITVNFNRKGQVGQQAGALYAFFNAAMQGSARIGQTIFTMDKGDIKTLRLNKTGKAIVYGGVLLGVMQAAALTAAGFGDDEPPEFVRERSLIFPIGNKKYISIPMPLGFHVLPNIGRIATEFSLNGFKKPTDHVIKLAGIFIEAFNPIGSAGMSLQTIAPTGLDPFAALAENRDWTGKNIAQPRFDTVTPGFSHNKDTATTLSKLIAEAINTLTGGDKYTAGALSPTADQLDYLAGQVGGGVWREGSKLEQGIMATITGEELPAHKFPLFGRFYGNADSKAGQGGTYYSNLQRIKEVKAGLEGRLEDKLPVDKFKQENPEFRLINRAKLAERTIQKLRKQKRELIERGEARDKVKATEERITQIMAQFNDSVAKFDEARP